MPGTSPLYALLDAAKQALQMRDGATAQRLTAIVLARHPEHLEARHLAGFAAYCLAFGDRPVPGIDNVLELCREAGNWHLTVGLVLEKGGRSELAREAFRTAALLDFHLLPAQRAGFGGPFNGQILRMTAFRALADSGRLAELVETGAHRGTTTEFMARHVACPVKTTESNGYFFELSRLRFEDLRQLGCGWAGNIELFPLDSRAFLTDMLRRPAPAAGVSFFYLDAHGDYIEWQSVENPLVAEVGLIRAGRPDCIVMIDDFAVPDDPAYGFDRGNSLDDLAPLLPRFDAWFFPLDSRHDTGPLLRGSIVLSGSPDTTALLSGIAELRPAE